MTTASEVAQWMVDRIQADNDWHYQETIASEIEQQFGSEWVYDNENGSPAISKTVLSAFRKLHGGAIKWNRSERAWSSA